MSKRTLGKGFFPNHKSDKLRYFDKDKFITLGSGDPLFSNEQEEEEEIVESDENLSKLFAILTTLIFFTDPSESNIVLMDTQSNTIQVLRELFPDYIFLSHGEMDKESLSTMNPIIICDSILEDSRDYEQLNPYLIMGDFLPEENLTFYDGIILRPIYGSIPKLIVKGISYRDWDKKNLHRMLQHHLQVVRKDYHFFDPVDGSRRDDRDSSYDRVASKYILSRYLKKVNIDMGNVDVVEEIIGM